MHTYINIVHTNIDLYVCNISNKSTSYIPGYQKSHLTAFHHNQPTNPAGPSRLNHEPQTLNSESRRPVNDWFTAGTLVYPLTFMITDITNRVLGKESAQRVVYCESPGFEGLVFRV